MLAVDQHEVEAGTADDLDYRRVREADPGAEDVFAAGELFLELGHDWVSSNWACPIGRTWAAGILSGTC